MELARHGLAVEAYLPRCIIVDTSPPNIINDEGINQLYNAADVGVNTTDGEGYGLCQLEHMFTGAPQVVTDVGGFRSFMDETVAEFIPPKDRVYFAGSMPLGSYAPIFMVSDVADAMGRALDTLDDKRVSLKVYKFKSWSRICDPWLDDVLKATST